MARTVTLWRPVGPEELALVAESGFRRWPPRLPHQPIFYPVMNRQYAEHIARRWNVRAHGSGHVTRFEVDADFIGRYDVHRVGGETINELWVPADELEDLNLHIVGLIEVVASYG